MPIYARQNSAFLAIVNLSETPCDDMCDVLIRDKAGDVLQRIVEEVERGAIRFQVSVFRVQRFVKLVLFVSLVELVILKRTN